MRMRSDLGLITWPLPWWAVAPPSLVIAAMTYWTFSQTSSWVYISRPVLSGLPREAVFGTGPLSCVMAALIAATFLDRRTQLSWPIAPRAAWQLQLRVTLMLMGWWCAAFALIAGAYTLMLLTRSDAGHYYPAEALLAVPMLAVFIATGSVIGVLVSRWWAPAIALIVAGVMTFLPSELLRHVGFDPTIAAPLVFYLTGAFDHRALLASGAIALTAWWWAGLLATLLLLVGLARGFAGRGWITLALGTTACLGIAGLTMPLANAALFTPDTPSAALCKSTTFGAQVCVATEEQELLPLLLSETERMAARVDYWPEAYTLIASDRGWDSFRAEQSNQSEASTLVVPLSVYGTTGAVQTIAGLLSGLNTCIDQNRATGPTYELALWILDDPGSVEFLAQSPDWSPVPSETDDDVRTWYTENREALLTCAYTPEGS